MAAVIVKDQRIISTGYNGTPRGVKNCFEGGCPRAHSNSTSGSDLGNGICNHAEENAIIQAAYHGISVKDSTLYCTLSPCLLCAKMIINAGISEVVYETEYGFSPQTAQLLNSVNIICRQRTHDKGTRDMKIIGIIPAGVPPVFQENVIAPIAGKPMIQRVVERAQTSEMYRFVNCCDR